MSKFICTNCNYPFNLENPFDCPCCGNNRIEGEKRAEEFLEEVNRLLEQ